LLRGVAYGNATVNVKKMKKIFKIMKIFFIFSNSKFYILNSTFNLHLAFEAAREISIAHLSELC